MQNKACLQGVGVQVSTSSSSQRSYREIKQRQNGIQQLINSSSNSSFVQGSSSHTRNNSYSSSNIAQNNINQSMLQNNINHQISHKQQPNISIIQRRDDSQNSQQNTQSFQQNNNQGIQAILNGVSNRNQLIQIIQKNASSDQLSNQAKYIPDTNRIPHQEKQSNPRRVISESDSDYNKENMSFCVNSIQSNQQRSYNYETSFNSKSLNNPANTYFIPQQVKQTRRTTNMSTDFSNHNNSQRNHTNSQNNSGAISLNTNSNQNNCQINLNQLNKLTNVSSRLLTNALNDSQVNDKIIDNYIERVFQKDFQSKNSQQQAYQSNQNSRQTKNCDDNDNNVDDDSSFTQLNFYSQHTQPQQQSANQSNIDSHFNTEQSQTALDYQQEQKVQSHITLSKQIQSQTVYEQALQQKLRLLPTNSNANAHGKDNKNIPLTSHIPRPISKSEQASQMSQYRNLQSYLFADASNSTHRKESHNSSQSSQQQQQQQQQQDESEQKQIYNQMNRNILSSDNQIKPFKVAQKEREDESCGVGASLYESEICRENKVYYTSMCNSNSINQDNQSNKQIQELQNQIQEGETKYEGLEITLIEKVKQIEQMESQIHSYLKEKNEYLLQIQKLEEKSIKEGKQIQEKDGYIQQLSATYQKQQQKIKQQEEEIGQLNMHIFEMEEQIFEMNANFKEKERIFIKEKNDQHQEQKYTFDNEIAALKQQLISIQSTMLKQTETIDNLNLQHDLKSAENIENLNKQHEKDKTDLLQRLINYENEIQHSKSQINLLNQQIESLKNKQISTKNEEVIFLEQQLSESERELKDYKKKFRQFIQL